MSVFEVLSRKKSFDNRWIGNENLNKAGLHSMRMRLADTCLAFRRFGQASHDNSFRVFQRDGIILLPNFLPADHFERLKAEALKQFQAAAVRAPIGNNIGHNGFGQKNFFEGGFDRQDGGTINRFLKISAKETPECFQFAQHIGLTALYRKAAGSRRHPEKFWLYQIVHGDEHFAPDIQKALHRDTFHSAIKMWFFLEDVQPEHGPFEYIPGSHRMTARRKQWEYIKSLRSSSGKRTQYQGGAFRASEADLRFMGLGQPKAYPVNANTLVLADIRGFHRRGQAKANNQRLSIYANIRPHPFALI